MGTFAAASSAAVKSLPLWFRLVPSSPSPAVIERPLSGAGVFFNEHCSRVVVGWICSSHSARKQGWDLAFVFVSQADSGGCSTKSRGQQCLAASNNVFWLELDSKNIQMFYLSRIEHTLRVPPSMLHLPILDAIKGELEKLFLDKVVANLGLCISVYDIRSVDGGFIFPSDGAATYKVVFTLIVFRPFVGEIIIGKVKESDANGLRISLGFFEDIYVPIHLLPSPSEFKPDPKNGGKRRWVWDYDGQPYDIYETDEIKFRIHSIEYPAIPVEQPKESNSKFPMEEQPKESTNVKAFAPMIVTATIDYDGLGPVSWWDGSGDADAEAEAEVKEDS